jgi:hypothetical protein
VLLLLLLLLLLLRLLYLPEKSMFTVELDTEAEDASVVERAAAARELTTSRKEESLIAGYGRVTVTTMRTPLSLLRFHRWNPRIPPIGSL